MESGEKKETTGAEQAIKLLNFFKGMTEEMSKKNAESGASKVCEGIKSGVSLINDLTGSTFDRNSLKEVENFVGAAANIINEVEAGTKNSELVKALNGYRHQLEDLTTNLQNLTKVYDLEVKEKLAKQQEKMAKQQENSTKTNNSQSKESASKQDTSSTKPKDSEGKSSPSSIPSWIEEGIRISLMPIFGPNSSDAKKERAKSELKRESETKVENKPAVMKSDVQVVNLLEIIAKYTRSLDKRVAFLEREWRQMKRDAVRELREREQKRVERERVERERVERERVERERVERERVERERVRSEKVSRVKPVKFSRRKVSKEEESDDDNDSYVDDVERKIIEDSINTVRAAKSAPPPKEGTGDQVISLIKKATEDVKEILRMDATSEYQQKTLDQLFSALMDKITLTKSIIEKTEAKEEILNTLEQITKPASVNNNATVKSTTGDEAKGTCTAGSCASGTCSVNGKDEDHS